MGILPHVFCLLIKSIVQLCYIFVIELSRMWKVWLGVGVPKLPQGLGVVVPKLLYFGAGWESSKFLI